LSAAIGRAQRQSSTRAWWICARSGMGKGLHDRAR
jgi:hypothetical protein